MNKKLLLIPIILGIILSVTVYSTPEFRWEVGKTLQVKSGTSPFLVDSNIVIEEVAVGLNDVSSFDFLSETEIIFLEKSKGHVRLIQDGVLQKEPLYIFENVHNSIETGLLGVLVSEKNVYFYVNEFINENRDTANNIYKFEWDGEKLINKKLVGVLPSMSCCHHGGYMVEDSNGNILAVIGDLERVRNSGIVGPLQNAPKGDLNDSSVIVYIEHEEGVLTPLKSENPLEHYYAIGIRNSFGMAIDPLTGNLWNTENGQTTFDEINLVKPKFNSGWALIQGPAKPNVVASLPSFENFEYSDPEFSWENVVAPTGIAIAGENWGDRYKNSVFVGDYIFGNLYKFELNSSRDSFVFQNDELKDLVLNQNDNYDEIIFGENFGRISDIKFSPDGSLYVATHVNNGAVFKLTLSS